MRHCVPLAPEVLKLSGEEALTYDPNPDDTQRLRVLRAAAACPVQAIIVDKLDTEYSGPRVSRETASRTTGALSLSALRWPGCAPPKRCGKRVFAGS